MSVFIQTTMSDDGQAIVINSDHIVLIEPTAGHESDQSYVVLTNGKSYNVDSSATDLLALINPPS